MLDVAAGVAGGVYVSPPPPPPPPPPQEVIMRVIAMVGIILLSIFIMFRF